MQTVVETPAYLLSCKGAGISDESQSQIIDLLANDPALGNELRGTGGCRKFRVGGRGKGKSGSFRIVHFYTGPDLPVFLLTAFDKGEKDDISDAEANALAALTKRLADSYRAKAMKMDTRR